jgi:hypothetical protein
MHFATPHRNGDRPVLAHDEAGEGPHPTCRARGYGDDPEEDESVKLVEQCLELAEFTIHRAVAAQIAAGAKAILVCEPAANTTYISPRQLRSGSAVFERFVVEANRRIRKMLDDAGVDLIFMTAVS